MFFFLNGGGNAWFSSANDQVVDNFIHREQFWIGSILNVIRIFGTGVALIMLAVMSIQYFTADGRGMPGSVERKADIKSKQLRNFAIGVGIFIGASNILYFIANFIEDILGDVL
ncbi:MAG: hypothetical protein IJ867_05500 [Clostridia bacterium]|nr:hypothetical protein [Clostridia bacterium]